jgi:hypothetical protein
MPAAIGTLTQKIRTESLPVYIIVRVDTAAPSHVAIFGGSHETVQS